MLSKTGLESVHSKFLSKEFSDESRDEETIFASLGKKKKQKKKTKQKELTIAKQESTSSSEYDTKL